MVIKKRALRGLADLSIFPVTKNDIDGYTVGAKIGISGAQELTSQKEIDEWKIYADDGLYDTGADWKGSKFTLQLAGLTHEQRVYFEGGEYNSTTKEYVFKSVSEAPEIALSFSSIADSDTKELTKVYSAKCLKVSFEHKTKGGSGNVVPVKIEGVFMERKFDKAIFTKKDGATTDISWLNTIASLPTV